MDWIWIAIGFGFALGLLSVCWAVWLTARVTWQIAHALKSNKGEAPDG